MAFVRRAVVAIMSAACVAWMHVGCACAEADASAPVSPLMADRYVAGVGGPVEAHLEDQKGWRLAAVTVAGRRYAAGDDFPTFLVLDKQGQRHALSAQGAAWQAERVAQSTVRYSANGLAVELRYALDRDRLHIVAKVLSEGDWKLIALSGTPLTRSMPSPDYVVDGSGWLVFPDVPKATERKWDANSDNLIGGATTAAFVGWREPDRIVLLKPLTFSHWLGWSATPSGTTCQFELRTGLYFRPPETKLFETKLCHDALALRIETAGDVNGDGEVDWVDAGIAYRERYVKRHEGMCFRQRLRDAFRVYHQVFAFPNCEAAFADLPQIDFADGIWWCKGVMAFVDDRDSEAHPFTVRPHPKLGDLAAAKKAMTDARQWTGIYYGHDYITLDAGDWPDEFVKRDPDGKPFRYYSGHGHQKFYKDNVRSVATGAVFRHYEDILRICLLGAGDPVMLDTYTAFARCGYHPEFPATPELETQAKHRLGEFLHEKGLIVAGEGLVEGTQDIVDYGAYSVNPTKAVQERWWEKKDGVQRVPMLPVVFQGSGYHGAGWYELRNPNPNWAIGLVYGVGYWDWLPQGTKHAWTRFARYYFNQNLAWAAVADLKVQDVSAPSGAPKDSRFTLTYEDGSRLWVDVDANRWTLATGGKRYDGFTPLSPRGYMAVLAQGNFEITLPGSQTLEISPQQPFRNQIRFECSTWPNRTVIQGKFGHLKWRIPLLKTGPGGKETTETYEADPVLVLRKVR